ncbi:hypothetical protein V8C44DRAFT_342338 [Trichoderma aethiopicum]
MGMVDGIIRWQGFGALFFLECVIGLRDLTGFDWAFVLLCVCAGGFAWFGETVEMGSGRSVLGERRS